MVSAPSRLSYFNPLSTEHHALKNSRKLSGEKQVFIWAISVIAATLGLGVGGVAAFRTLVNRCTENTDFQAKVTGPGVKNVSGRDLAKTILVLESNPDKLKQEAKAEAKKLVIKLKNSLLKVEKLSTAEKRTFNNMILALTAYSKSGDLYEPIEINHKGSYKESATCSIFGEALDNKLGFQKALMKLEQSKEPRKVALASVGRELIAFSGKVFKLPIEGEVIEDVN